ncbi:MAG: nucleotide exchange factor GrpE [Bacteroidales bacterium]|jgi:molecular chaperone GrpE|nr:nucleotide exchange factor GrpE [Bacteroidales bacterium]MCU0407847.1 nucleotide exchange factor GrpE [Bacteroidales bacterium]
MKKQRENQEEENRQNINEQTDNESTAPGNTETEPVSSPPGEAEPDSTATKAGEDNREAQSDKAVTDDRMLEEKLAEMQDRYLRLSAEFDNYRKRTLREKMEISKYAGENVFRSLLPLMDDFDRALSHMGTTSDCTAIRDGLGLIYSKFNEFLKQNGVNEIDSLNREFNVDLHEAVAKLPAENEEQKGKVLDVLTKGYYLQDKVLRFAKVVVGE